MPEIENSTAIANKVYSVPTTDTIKLTVPKSIFISNSGEITKLSFLITQADEVRKIEFFFIFILMIEF